VKTSLHLWLTQLVRRSNVLQVTVAQVWSGRRWTCDRAAAVPGRRWRHFRFLDVAQSHDGRCALSAERPARHRQVSHVGSRDRVTSLSHVTPDTSPPGGAKGSWFERSMTGRLSTAAWSYLHFRSRWPVGRPF